MNLEIDLKLREILKQIYGVDTPVDEINPKTSLADLGVNSLGILKLMSEVERQFGIEFSDEDFDYKNFYNLENMTLYIEQRLSA